MSYEDGWAAVNLEMPTCVPRTEFSAEMFHWQLLKAVTGIDVGVKSPDEVKEAATQAFVRAWNYDIMLSSCIGGGEFGQVRSSMGHAIYAIGEGSSRDMTIISTISS